MYNGEHIEYFKSITKSSQNDSNNNNNNNNDNDNNDNNNNGSNNGIKITESMICNYYISKLKQIIKNCDTNINNEPKIGSFLIESVIGCGGQVFLPTNLLSKASLVCKNYDILLIVDEV